jgi:hypothetical protein
MTQPTFFWADAIKKKLFPHQVATLATKKQISP